MTLQKHTYLFFFVVVSSLGCTDRGAEVLIGCNHLDGREIISEDHGLCNYLNIYWYRDELYSTCRCCNCDKVDVAVDCNGDFICGFGNTSDIKVIRNCMDQFYTEAEFLFSTSD